MSDDAASRRHQNAVALAYQDGDGAPKVVAKGKGLMAQQIIGRAQQAGVFVHESKELVALLMEVDLDRQIPPALYRAIAELLAWLYHIESAQGNGGPATPVPDVVRLINT
ncbi:flagellar biosynthetic protein FlhB [Massilia eurypsychrophila]|jgi:flagellar biosynthesis protein|uniref:Flagellar biosynthetic protein FlhB n=1 Tax=Massilia eurypsychrophila TaxID=1485217 RepID=A0A2G8TBF5_9BURK|nr:EscU/YscU/HrcU family type III secretion system export apparatus switch protein [Massilia eurypsychrophila]PIL43380.1 flagellar biosynthetic protein FlhB [Massilia eurypsychrophila]